MEAPQCHCVGTSPSLSHVVHRIEVEGRTWKQVGILKGDVEALFGALVRWVSTKIRVGGWSWCSCNM